MMLTILAIVTALSVATSGDQPTESSITPKEAMIRAHALAASDSGRVAIVTIGKSWSGHLIEAIVLSDKVSDAANHPAFLLVSGLDGMRPSSVSIAVNAAKRLLDTPEILKDNTFYVIPCANPDVYFAPRSKSSASGNRNHRPFDEDRDGRVDEDPPVDLDGDGVITQMRRINPPANDPPTHLPDPTDVRLMRTADATKNQRPTHTIYTEGIDADSDGFVAEDDIGGVDIDRNFPHRWPEFDPSAGSYQLSEPESQAISTFVLEHPRIVASLVIGRWDNLVKTPDSQAKDVTGRTPLALDSGDLAIWSEMGRKWRDLSGGARAVDVDPSGSLALWLYAHRGIPTFATQSWGRPDASPAPPLAEPVAPVTADATTPVSPVAQPAEKLEDEEATGWLAWSDRDQAGKGFIEWKSFKHPTLGDVEIGGFRPGFRSDPPLAEVSKLDDAVAGFISELARRQPRVVLRNVTSRESAPGIYEIEAEIVNTGWFPTATAMGKINQQSDPVVVRLSLPKDRIQSGQRVTIVDGLAGAGGQKSFRWLVQASPSESIVLETTWKPMGTIRASITGDRVSEAKVVNP